jgi:hypothetical protein
VGAVLVADDGHDDDLAVGGQAAFVVGFGQYGVEAFQDALGDAGGVPDPAGGGDHQDVGGQDAFAQGGPVVAVAHVESHPRPHVVVDDPDGLALDTLLAQRGQHLFGRQPAAGRCG